RTLAAAGAQLTASEEQLNAETIGGAFSRSKITADKLATPAALVQARFGNAFKVEDGEVVAYDQNNQKIYSRENPGSLAGFDEALEILIDAYPNKEHILKSSGANGGGAGPSGGGGHQAKGDFGGDKKDRVAAIASRFPDLAKA